MKEFTKRILKWVTSVGFRLISLVFRAGIEALSRSYTQNQNVIGGKKDDEESN